MINILQVLLLVGILTGCGAMNAIPLPESPTAVQQLLMAQAVERSLHGENTRSILLTSGDTVSLDISGLHVEDGLTVAQGFFKGAIGGWLGESGLKIVLDPAKAKYRIHILVQGLGVEQRSSLFGLPPIQSALLPIALPEIAIYASQKLSGYTRFRLDIYETETGQFVRSTPWFQGSTYFNEYTILFFFDFEFTDLIAPF
ncbi:hypothetical protein [Candidatus Nitrospira neomarina]|uniref:Uncharacterized protein n=1 Tax=Candidatus Nitrospira neomarina TaxID=3020899 RepID=A0AA96GST7_9BACT|nr:hypothetical protein [Candidatus Nitrospira neomarina]WNM62921.1 hypothetical protein PQG83_03980 [Candidatus Nitrospira neomarina]